MVSGKETDMSERMVNRDLRKQIGCMNGIFQLLDPNHFLVGRRVNGRNHKRLIQGAQHHVDPKDAPKAVMAEDLEVQKEKSRSSMESSRLSYSSSSSCSSMFSSLECSRTDKPESLLRQTETGMPETRSRATKEQKSHDLQDVVKDSLYRQTHGLSVKCQAKDEIRGLVLKHVDSPRPLELPKYVKPKAKSAERSTRVLDKLQDTNSFKDERLALPRLSYDGRESRETSKSTMKLKELPRLSLDSSASTMKCSALGSRLDFLGCELPMENEKWSKIPRANQEPGSHNRSSSLVAKLMGLESFPDNVASSDSGITNINRCPTEEFVSRLSPTAENSNQNHVSYSSRITRNDPASPRFPTSNYDLKPSTHSRLPMEPAPWRNQDSSQDSPKVASQSRIASTNIQHRSSSVYGEIEKRITELEFKRSGKDLRALKRILEAMEKTRDRMENQRESVQFASHTRTYSLDERCSVHNHCSSTWHNKKNHQQAFTINELPKIADSSIVIMKPATVMNTEKLSRSTQVSRITIQHLQRFQNQDSKRYRDNSVHKQAAEDLKARKNDLSVSSPHDPSIEKKITKRTSKVEQTLKATPRMKVKGCNNFGRSSESVSPRLTENRGRIERQCNPTTLSSDSGTAKGHFIKKVIEKGSNARELNIKSTNLQLTDDQFSERSSKTRDSSNQGGTASIKSEDNISLSSQMATEVTGIVRSINTNTKTHEASQKSVATLIEHMPTVKVAGTMMEQPSPVSVLDTTIYEEDSPSPIKKISTAFREDESSNPDEALWNQEKLNHLPPNPCCEYNQKKLENIKHLIHELRLKTKPDEATAKETASVDVGSNQHHKYINKMILTSGLLEDVNFISMTDQLHSSSHLINPNMFHILEKTEETMDEADGEHNRKSEWFQSSCRSHRKVVFDMVNEIYARKIASDGSFSPGMKRVSPQVLIKEIYLEVDRLQQKAECNLDEEDGLIRILNADMKYQPEDWADYGVEVRALVLDIERMIFKDLVNELVMSDTMGLHDWPKKHCRQLFRK